MREVAHPCTGKALGDRINIGLRHSGMSLDKERPTPVDGKPGSEEDRRPAQVIGPLGEPLTLETLPPVGSTRWVMRRKAEVVSAVAGRLLTTDEACDRYNLSLEEFASWQRAVTFSGMLGLRVTQVQHYRALHQRPQRG